MVYGNAVSILDKSTNNQTALIPPANQRTTKKFKDNLKQTKCHREKKPHTNPRNVCKCGELDTQVGTN